MDKEAQEKIASRIIVDCGYDSEYPCPHNMPLNDCPHEDKELCMWQLEQAEGILNALFELGYRKLPKDRPELWEKIKDIQEYETLLCLNPTEVGKDDCGYETGSLACQECQRDQILALIPDEKEGLAPLSKQMSS